MIELCREQGLSEPVFEEYSGGLAVVFRFKEHISAVHQKTILDNPMLTPRQEEILCILKKHGAVGIKQFMTQLTDPPSQRMVGKDLNHLKELGLIEFSGSARNILWRIKMES